MRTAHHDTWRRYEQALLTAMGYAAPPPQAPVTAAQLLIIPTFTAPCCARLTLAGQDGELRCSILLHGAGALFHALWRGAADGGDAQAPMVCLEASAALAAAEVVRVRQRLAALAPERLADIDLAARDGVSLRYDGYDQRGHTTVALRAPTAPAAPQHTALIRLFLDTVQEHVAHPQIQEQLVALRRSLGM